MPSTCDMHWHRHHWEASLPPRTSQGRPAQSRNDASSGLFRPLLAAICSRSSDRSPRRHSPCGLAVSHPRVRQGASARHHNHQTANCDLALSSTGRSARHTLLEWWRLAQSLLGSPAFCGTFAPLFQVALLLCSRPQGQHKGLSFRITAPCACKCVSLADLQIAVKALPFGCFHTSSRLCPSQRDTGLLSWSSP